MGERSDLRRGDATEPTSTASGAGKAKRREHETPGNLVEAFTFEHYKTR